MVSEQLNDPEDLPATDPVDAFLAYPFSTDAVYQVRIVHFVQLLPDDELFAYKQGLDSITASGAFEGKSEEERAALMRSSQVYYFSRSAATQVSRAQRTDGLIGFTALRAVPSPWTMSSNANARGSSAQTILRQRRRRSQQLTSLAL